MRSAKNMIENYYPSSSVLVQRPGKVLGVSFIKIKVTKRTWNEFFERIFKVFKKICLLDFS